MSEVRISVAVATYNGEIYLREQLDSILHNLSEMDEIVISDDGSTDKTVEIIEEYIKKDNRIRFIQGPGAGVKQNIANAMKKCQGSFLFLADQDDVWTEDKVGKVMEYLGKEGCHLVLHDAKVMDADLKEIIMPSFFAYRGSKPGACTNIWKNRYMGCCMAFDRELLNKILPIPNEIEMHDQWIGVMNDLTGGHTICLDKKLLYYRRHDKNVSDFNHGTVFAMLKKRFVFCRALFRHKKNGKM